MRPSSGRTKPAMESSTRVFPAPLGPNRIVTPALAENSTSSENPAESAWGGNVLRSSARIMNAPNSARRETVGERQNGERHRGDNQHESASHSPITSLDRIVDGDRDGLSASWNISRDHQS